MAEGLPASIVPLFNVLHRDASDLWLRWNTFQELYRSSEVRIQLLNRTAPSFFGLLQKILADDVLSGIARLTDPPSTSGKQNATLRQLLKLLKEISSDATVDPLAESLNAIDALSKPIRVVRNKMTSHRDLEVALNPQNDSVRGVPYATIAAAMVKISEFLNLIQQPYTGDFIDYANTIPAPGDVGSLVRWLSLADEHRKKLPGTL